MRVPRRPTCTRELSHRPNPESRPSPPQCRPNLLLSAEARASRSPLLHLREFHGGEAREGRGVRENENMMRPEAWSPAQMARPGPGQTRAVTDSAGLPIRLSEHRLGTRALQASDHDPSAPSWQLEGRLPVGECRLGLLSYVTLECSAAPRPRSWRTLEQYPAAEAHTHSRLYVLFRGGGRCVCVGGGGGKRERKERRRSTEKRTGSAVVQNVSLHTFN